MKKLKLIAAMSCIWVSSHALALEQPATLTPANPLTSAVDIASLNLNAEDTAILQKLSLREKNSIVGGDVPIWDRLTENQKISFIVAISGYFVTANAADIIVTAIRKQSDNDAIRKAIITNVCNGIPIVGISRLASSYQIGVARADALSQGLASRRLSRAEIAAMVGYSVALVAFSKGCAAGAEILYPSGRRLSTVEDSEALLVDWVEHTFDVNKNWVIVANDYWLYPGDRNKEAQRKLDLANQLSATYDGKFAALLNKENDIALSLRQIANAEDDYQVCQSQRLRNPGCAARAAKAKSDNIIEMRGQLGAFKILLQGTFQVQKDILDLYGINTAYRKIDTQQYNLRIEIQ